MKGQGSIYVYNCPIPERQLNSVKHEEIDTRLNLMLSQGKDRKGQGKDRESGESTGLTKKN